MPDELKPIRYTQWRRWADAYQGWRDGHSGIPERPKRPGPVTTPHREALIRLAQDAFAHEHLEYRKLVAGPHRRVEAARSRLAAAKAALTWAESAVRAELAPLTEPETTRRRLGEENRPESVIVQRRLREHAKQRAQARSTVTQAQSTVLSIEGDLAQAEQAAKQQHEAAAVRVQRIHQHIHRRLAVYRRALVRVHPDGAWVNWALSPQAPEIPTWALPDAYLPEGPRPHPPGGDSGDSTEVLGQDDAAEEAGRIIELRHEVTRFGSASAGSSDGDIGYETLDSPLAAPWHFTIVKAAGGVQLRARGYGHGPYIDGEPVGTADLAPGDFFDFGEHRYTVLDASRLLDERLPRPVLIAADLNATTNAKARLSRMSFVQRANTLMAVLGPSGAGKSSLCFALLGELPLQSGRLFFREMPMATHLRQIRDQVSFVPQNTVLHMSLSVLATLRYGFSLRSPCEPGRDARIDNVLKAVGLTDRRNQLLCTLSGGQLRRVSIALELLTDRPLLMLDEPTSGLDASMDRQIMNILRQHAGRGHTVIVVTHATEHLPTANQVLVVVDGGAPVYSGPPRQIRKKLNFKTYADLMSRLLNEERRTKYVRDYQAGAIPREAERVADDLDRQSTPASTQAGHGRRGVSGRSFRAASRQFRVLVRRQCVLLATGAQKEPDPTWLHRIKNARFALTPLLVAMGAAALAALVAGPPGLGAAPSVVGPTALTLLTTLCVLSGQALTYSDVVSEFEIIQREFRAGVGVLPVLTAKWLVFAVMAVGQAGLITLVFCWVPDRAPQRSVLLGPETDLFLGLAALSVSAMTLGILVSALATKLEHAVALITATSIAQIALNGVTSDLSTTSFTSVLGWLLPDRWGLAATASSIDLRGINQGHPTQVSPDALWVHSTGQWVRDLLPVAVLSVLFYVSAAVRLHTRLKPPAQRGR